jgi:hypothetical protein
MKRNAVLLVAALAVAGYVGLSFNHRGALTLAILPGLVVLGLILHRPRFGLWLLLLALPIAPVGGVLLFRIQNFLIPGLILGSWILLLLWTRSAPRLLPTPLGVWFLAFLFWTVISSLLGEFPRAGLGVALRFGLLAMILLAITSLWTLRDLGRVMAASSFLLLPIAV